MRFELKKTFVFFILLLFLAQSCLDPKEKNGQCTKCDPAQLLDNGTCYLKMRGCLTQSQFTCTECQQGYILSDNACIREADFYHLETLTPPPQKIDESKLKPEQITPVIAGGFKEVTDFSSYFFLSAKSKLYNQYPQLTSFKLFKVEQQLVNGINYLFYIIDLSKYDMYLAKVYVSFTSEASVSEIYKNDVSIKHSEPKPVVQTAPSLPGGWRVFVQINDSGYLQSVEHVLKTFDGLEKYTLEKTEYQVVAGTNFLFYFLNTQWNEKFYAKVYRPFYGPCVVTSTWGNMPCNVVGKEQPKTVDSNAQNDTAPLAGGFETVLPENYNDQTFVAVQQAIKKVLPIFSTSIIKSVQRQLVAGWNYFVKFTDPASNDTYDLTVFVPLAYTGEKPSVTEIKKNGSLYKVQSTTELPTQIQIPIVGGYQETNDLTSPFYLQAIATLTKQYPNLQTLKIVKVQQQIVNGVNFLIYLKDEKTQDFYLAKIYVALDQQTEVNELYENEENIKNPKRQIEFYPPVQGQWQEWTDKENQRYLQAKNLILDSVEGLSLYDLEKVQYQVVAGYNFMFFFVNSTNHRRFTAKVYVPLAGPSEISATWGRVPQKPVQEEPIVPSEPVTPLAGGHEQISTSEYEQEPFLSAQAAILEVFPDFTVDMIKKVQKQLVAGWNVFVTFEKQDSKDVYELKVYVPLQYTGEKAQITEAKMNGETYEISNNQNTSETEDPTLPSPPITQSTPVQQTQPKGSTLLQASSPLAGRYEAIQPSQYNEDPFLSAKSAILKVFSDFTTKLVTKAQKQLVAGWNVFVTFSLPNSKDVYDVTVYCPLAYTGDEPSITSLKKNGVDFVPSTKTSSGSSTQASSVPITPSTKPPVSTSTPTQSKPSSQGNLLLGGWSQTTGLTNPMFLSAKSKLFQAYPELNAFNMTKVQEQLVNGVNYQITLTDTKTRDNYVAQVYVSFSLQAQVKSVAKNNVEYKPSKSEDSPVNGGWALLTNFKDANFLAAQSQLLKTYPELSSYKLKSVHYQVVNGYNFQFYYVHQALNLSFVAKVAKPLKGDAQIIEIQGTIPQDVTTPESTAIRGGRESFDKSEYASEEFGNVVAAIQKVFGDFKIDFITKVQRQLVSGWNYFVTFAYPNSKDVYEIKVYAPLAYTGQKPQISQILKNSQPYNPSPISVSSTATKITPSYSHLTDPYFPPLYKFLISQVKILNIPPIVEVTRQQKSINNNIKFYQYNITYSSDQYAVGRYYYELNLYEVVSYVADKTELYKLVQRMGGSKLYDRSENVLTQLVRQYDQRRFDRMLVSSIVKINLSSHYKLYQLSAFLSDGHFTVSILDDGSLRMIDIRKVDTKTCFSIDSSKTVQLKQQYIIDQLKVYLFSKYTLTGFELTNVVVNVKDAQTTQYLLLLTRADIKKIKVIVEEAGEKFVIKKIDVLNDGYYQVQDLKGLNNALESVKKDYGRQVVGYELQAVFNNGSSLIAYLGDQSSFLTYTKTSSTKDLKLKTFSSSLPCTQFKDTLKTLCSKCKPEELLFSNKCYTRQQNCSLQVGSQCIVCDKFSTLNPNGKCIRQCSDLFN